MKLRHLLAIPAVLLLTGAVPGLSEFERALVDAESRAEDAATVGHATSALQNALARRMEAGTLTCADPEVRSMLARARHLGHAYRDAAQAFRVRAEKVQRLALLPTVEPLLSGELGERRTAVVERAAEEVARYRTTAGWQAQLLEPAVRGCDAPLAVGPGLRPPDDPTVDVAVIGIGTGRICPANVEAQGAVVVLERAEACFALEVCSCTPTPVGHGAVLGEPS